MPPHLFIAPAAHGKTAFAVREARNAVLSGGFGGGVVRVVVASGLQVAAFRRRLALAGGALGVRVMTFDRLHAECLVEAGVTYTELPEPVLYRLVATLIENGSLDHYAPLIGFPGFTQTVLQLFGELKANQVHPDTLTSTVAALDAGPRLAELAALYSAYQAQLQQHAWADRAGAGWLALEALDPTSSGAARDWPLLVVDGFDDFSRVQLALLERLAARVRDLVITLTGAPGSRPRVHQRFDRARRELEETLRLTAAPLPGATTAHHPALAALEAGLYRTSQPVAGEAPVEMLAATDRLTEVRAALRWLKERILLDGIAPGEVAILARDLSPYQAFVEQVAAEFGLPLRVAGGFPLAGNPAVDALHRLLALVQPSPAGDGPLLPRRGVVDVWRCPYFDWSAALPAAPILPGDAEDLDRLARWGRVAGGANQWDEMFARVEQAPPDSENLDDDRGNRLPVAREAGFALRGKFAAFLVRISPPGGKRSFREFACWLEDLMGSESGAPLSGSATPANLQIMARASQVPASAQRDEVALRVFKQVLLGLVWAEEALGVTPVDFSRFLGDLTAAISAAACHPRGAAGDEVLAADVIAARGLAFRAVALLGLSEGEFPATIGEDHFMRDDDRAALEPFGVMLRPSTESNEAEYFYEALCRPRDRLLLTRPRVADNGAAWLPSPFWDAVRAMTGVAPRQVSAGVPPPPVSAASRIELLTSLAENGDNRALRSWCDATAPAAGAQSWSGVETAAAMVAARHSRAAPVACDGSLTEVAAACAARYDDHRYWSASGLESYRTCPFSFFVGRVLGLSPREEPEEDLDDRQRGNIFHRLLERTYCAARDPADPGALLAALDRVAPATLDEAPEREGFRATRWWQRTRVELEQAVRNSLAALAGFGQGYRPAYFELSFRGRITGPRGGFLLRGTIDRVDVDDLGRFRVIDYKSGGASMYTRKALDEGKKLQLALYALAGRDILRLGEPVSGFYFHIATGEPSDLQLERATGGVPAALETALAYAEETVAGARAGRFTPRPPPDGCPAFCAASAFCWHYAPGFHAQ